MSGGARPVVFLDRDGTLIRDAHYLRDPARVALLPGVVDALKRCASAGYALVVITNQSGIARGLLTEADYDAVRARLDAELARHGIALTDSLHCPHEPSISGPCDCRKPGDLLHRRAADTHHLSLVDSVCIGDRWRDVAPAQTLGGRGILVPSTDTPAEDIARATQSAEVAQSLEDAVSLVLGPRRG